MQKLLLVLSLASGVCFAAANDCSKAAQKVVDKLTAHQLSAISIDYSADKADWATTCKKAILAKNSSIQVTMTQVEGSGKFKFTR